MCNLMSVCLCHWVACPSSFWMKTVEKNTAPHLTRFLSIVAMIGHVSQGLLLTSHRVCSSRTSLVVRCYWALCKMSTVWIWELFVLFSLLALKAMWVPKSSSLKLAGSVIDASEISRLCPSVNAASTCSVQAMKNTRHQVNRLLWGR